MSGWICAHRKIWGNPVFKGRADRVGAFLWMVQTAAYKPTQYNVNGTIITLERGQLCASRREISEATGLTEKEVRGLIETLKRASILCSSGAKGRAKGKTVLTICNYNEYQDRNEDEGQEFRSSGAKQGPTKEQVNKFKQDSLPSEESSSDAHPVIPIPKPEPSEPSDASEIDEAFDAYNRAADAVGWPQCQSRSKPRIAKMRQRLREVGGLEGWTRAMARARASPFLTGANASGWRASIDFFLQQSSFTKLIEGSYDPRNPKQNSGARRSGQGGGGAGSLAEAGLRMLREGGDAGGISSIWGDCPDPDESRSDVVVELRQAARGSYR